MRRLPVFTRLVLAELAARPGRLVALVTTVALAAGVLMASLVLGSSLRSAADDGVRVAYRGADVVVSGESAGAANESVSTDAGATGATDRDVRALGRIPGVDAVGTVSRALAAAQAGDESRGIVLESLASDTSFRWQHWAAGRPPQAGAEVALTQHTLDQLRIGLGDRVALGRPEVGRAVFRIVGVVDTRGATAWTDSAYGIVTPLVAQRLAGLDGANQVLLGLEPGTDPRAVVDAVNETAPVGFAQTVEDLVSAGTGAERAKVTAVGAVVTGFALLALVVAALVLATTTTVSLASRLRALALQRCVGASRTQVFAQVTTEVAVLGVGAAVLGVVLGIATARAALPLAGLVPGLPDVASSAFTVRAGDVGATVLLVVGLSLLAGVVPAWRAARVAPAAALQPAASTTGPDTAAVVRSGLTSAVLLVAAATVLRATEGAGGAGAGLALLALGAFAGLGTLLRVISGLGRRAIRPGRAPAIRLALAGIATQPRRAAAEGVAVALAVALVALTWVGLGTVSSSLGQRLDAAPSPDLVVGTPTQGAAIDEEAIGQLRDVDGVAAAVAVPYGRDVTLRGRDGDRRVSVSIGTAALTTPQIDRALHDPFAVRPLRDDTVYLPSSATPPFPSDARISLDGPDGTVEDLAVAYVDDLESSVVTPAVLARVSEQTDVRTVWLRLAEGTDRARVVEQVGAIGVLAGPVTVAGPAVADLRVERALGTARAAATALLAVVVLVAVVGAAATTAASVSESGREHAVLRALGLDRVGLRRVLAVRTIVVGVVSAAVGAALGAVAAHVGSGVVLRALDLPAPDGVTGWPLVLLVVAVVGVVRAAAAVPLESAAHVSPARALAASA